MEFCGGHTVSVSRYGIRQVLPETIEMVSGPGCPVCVTANADLDKAIALSQLPDVIIATFGDMLKVPGSRSSLQKVKAEGADGLGVVRAYVKDYVAEKLETKGFIGLLPGMFGGGLVSIIIGVILWAIVKDVKAKIQTGDPLAVEKLAGMFEGRFERLHDRLEGRLDGIRDRLSGGTEPEPARTRKN